MRWTRRQNRIQVYAVRDAWCWLQWIDHSLWLEWLSCVEEESSSMKRGTMKLKKITKEKEERLGSIHWWYVSQKDVFLTVLGKRPILWTLFWSSLPNSISMFVNIPFSRCEPSSSSSFSLPFFHPPPTFLPVTPQAPISPRHQFHHHQHTCNHHANPNLLIPSSNCLVNGSSFDTDTTTYTK